MIGIATFRFRRGRPLGRPARIAFFQRPLQLITTKFEEILSGVHRWLQYLREPIADRHDFGVGSAGTMIGRDVAAKARPTGFDLRKAKQYALAVAHKDEPA